MPSPGEILEGLAAVANDWLALAIAWHVVAAALLGALLAGWRPTRAVLGAMLATPLLSVAALAFSMGNPFNGAVFGLLSVASGALTLARRRVPNSGSRLVTALGLAMIGFGWCYPHFLEADAALYLIAAPMGLVPCPTLAAVIGFGLLRNGLESRAWSWLVAGASLFYGIFGVFRLGVWLDIGLLAGAVALLLPPRRG